MITNTTLVIRPLVALAFLIAGLLLLRTSASRVGPPLIGLGALLVLGADLYGIFTLRPFVGKDYDDYWYAQVGAVEALDTIGLAVCACGLVAHAWSARAKRAV